MDKTAIILEDTQWVYSDQDTQALDKLRSLLQKTARKKTVITYSELVGGITFNIDSINNGQPYQIQTDHWQDLDRVIIGDFLGKLASESYRDYGFMISALSVDASTMSPSMYFFRWAKELGLLKDDSEEGRDIFWNMQLQKAYATKYYD